MIVQAHTLVVSRNCDGILVSPMREEEPRDTTVMVSLAIVIGASVVFIVLLLAVVSLAFYRWNLDTIQLELSTKFTKVSQYLEKARAKASPLSLLIKCFHTLESNEYTMSLC